MNDSLPIEEFLRLSERFPVIDVRSPAEFEQGHIPGAHNIPLFNNEERAKVGTAYKQTGRQKAIKIGLGLVGPKLKSFINQVEEIVNSRTAEHSNIRTFKHSNDELLPINIGTGCQLPTVLVHCWRGGMRSVNFAYLLNVYGYKTHTLVKGYKAYRNFVLKSFENAFPLTSHLSYPTSPLIVLGGETGSGKTEILKNIGEFGEQIIDLEAIAHHKGSAFGSLGEEPQPTQEQFENDLAYNFSKVLNFEKVIWMEDESRSIGTCQIPNPIWEKMKQAPIIRIKVSKEERIGRLMSDYGKFSKEDLANCIRKIEKRLGPQRSKQALEELGKGNLHEVADITLDYYDKTYNYNHEKRNFKDVFIVECKNADAPSNAKRVMEFAQTLSYQTAYE